MSNATAACKSWLMAFPAGRLAVNLPCRHIILLLFVAKLVGLRIRESCCALVSVCLRLPTLYVKCPK